MFSHYTQDKKPSGRIRPNATLEGYTKYDLTGPAGYLDFIALLAGSKLVLTDSGGLQEETTALGIPCLTLRKNTERPITVSQGTNTIVGNETEVIVAAAMDILETGGKSGMIPDLWDGNTAVRIADLVEKIIK